MTFVKGFPLILLVASMCSHGAVQPDRTRIILMAKIKPDRPAWKTAAINLPCLACN